MKIHIIYKDDYPWDVRVEKIANTAHELGYDVNIIANNFGKNVKKEKVDCLNILRIPPLTSFPNVIANILKLPFWFNPLWWRLLETSIDNNSIIIVRDLPLIKLAIMVAKKKNSKVIYDMAEVYPEMYKSMSQLVNQSLFKKIIKNPKMAERYEKDNIPKVDHTFTMIEESRERLLRNGIDASRVSIISNTPNIDTQAIKPHKHEGNTINIVYVGFLTELRGLDLLIEGVNKYISMVQSEGRSPDINVHIIGKGGVKESLKDLVIKLELQDYINIHGWLSHEEVAKLLKNANIGALTYRICGHWNHTIPNKIFDYMAAGLPVLSTGVTPIKRIVTETNCGLVSEPGDSITIAKSILALENAGLREQLGRNGQKAIIEKYNWANEKIKIRHILQDLGKK